MEETIVGKCVPCADGLHVLDDYRNISFAWIEQAGLAVMMYSAARDRKVLGSNPCYDTSILSLVSLTECYNISIPSSHFLIHH
jgi:hypothetical protein